MRTSIIRAAMLVALSSFTVLTPGCKADIHDNEVNVDATLDFKATANVDNVKPGTSVSVTMNASGVVLVDPKTTPPAGDEAKAAYFNIYLDDVDTDPLVATASTTTSVTIPPGTPEGDHHLICRLHKHDGTPTSTQQEISIKVSATASVTVGSPDAG